MREGFGGADDGSLPTPIIERSRLGGGRSPTAQTKGTAVPPNRHDTDSTTILTVEAFADTILPGEKRDPSDRAVAGAAPGPGAVAAGAIDLLELPGGGLAGTLPGLADALNGHAAELGAAADPDVPPFVALDFEQRTRLVQRLTAPDHPEKAMWVALALFCNMAFDSAAHLNTAAALEAGHPGLLTIGYRQPEPDGVWRFPSYSYGRRLADVHPATTSGGSPA
ncbi:hypothetical protein C8E87_5833 [Paractinoplanes brasiliensis]|uniref:Gluconate 2-dehydrogenase subunit 3-like protein n=1 Tax=Paractinoplanes brasiliensis TaxID=52695 RepID=A0A4R6JYY9_9ACTN|nr:hypothetical protein C8E87_5833 [Actinoplanes brasiliensis]GID33055.1 hypothetical protein Abr02nite_80380 [Actinoplanes brasiliensis]